ncbi:MAG: TonB-dependent receptor [Pyrinomonadaceae bacterium]
MTKKISIKFLAMVIFCLLLSVGSLFAQSQASTGQITGVVADSTGAVVPNATVTLTSKSTNQTQQATTSGEGIYRFVTLQPGTYSVKSSGSGFGEQTLDVEVQVGRTTDANFTLGAAGTTTTVEVTAEGIQTTSSNFDAVQDQTAIQNLPINGRRFQDFVTLTPSAQVDPSRGQISLSGQRGINTNVNVDGVDYNQPFFGGIRGGERSNSAFTIPQESIREFQVVAAGYSAEFGRSTGGIVNAVTKSGTNNFRGSAFYLIRPQRFARGNDFSKALRTQRLQALGLDATLAPTQQQFGGSIGGPIVKDKLFFFASYEQQRFRAPRQVVFTNLLGITPTAAQTEGFNFYRGNESPFTQSNDANAVLGRIDYNINDANRFNIRYNYSRNNAINGVSTGESSLDPTTTNSVSTNGIEQDRNHIAVAQLVSNISSNAINELRYQYARETRPRLSNSTLAGVSTFVGTFGARNFLPTTQFDVRNQIADSLTYIYSNHTFKFGGEFSNIHADQSFGFNQFGGYNFSGLNTATGVLDAISSTRVAGRLGRFDTSTARYFQQIGNLRAAYTVKQLAFFAQDSWRVTPKFTLNLGLRYEKQYNPSAEANNTPVIDAIKNASFPLLGGKGIDPTRIPDSQNEFGPRVGFAYDPSGNGKTVIRGFAGIYYAQTPLIELAAPFNNFRNPAGDLNVGLGPAAFTAATFSQTAFDAANPQYVAIVGGAGITPNTVYRQFAILGINLNNSSLSNLPTLTPAQLQTIADRIQAARTGGASALGVFQNANVIGINPNFKNPESYQFGGGIEEEIARDMFIGIDVSWVKTVFLERNIDVNIPAIQSFNQVTGRPTVNRNVSRPVSALGTIQLRDSSAISLYRSATFRLRMNRKWGQVNAFYTLSRSNSDDDNERNSGGVLYANPYNIHDEYGASVLDRTHQFVANPVFFLPYGFEVSSAIRLLSGNPINSTVGSDLNGDGNSTDRPYISPNVQLPRNFYRNRSIYNVDLRVQKGFGLGENRRLVFSTEFFNILGLSNLQIGGSATTNFCASTSDATCGLNGATNINFLQTRQQNTSSSTFGQLNLSGVNPGSQVFQVQFGARFQF